MFKYVSMAESDLTRACANSPGKGDREKRHESNLMLQVYASALSVQPSHNIYEAMGIQNHICISHVLYTVPPNDPRSTFHVSQTPLTDQKLLPPPLSVRLSNSFLFLNTLCRSDSGGWSYVQVGCAGPCCLRCTFMKGSGL